MAGQGPSVKVRGVAEDVEVGEVWESGHFAGSGVEGRVRRTPAGWSVSGDAGPIGGIGRDGVAKEVPLRLEGGAVLHGDRVLARVDDESFAAGALALVWLGRRAWYAPAEPPKPSESASSAAPAAGGRVVPWVLATGVLLLLLVLGGVIVLAR